MPIKYNLMNYDIIANNIHKLQLKNESELSDSDKKLMALAILIASFSSSFSWKTYRWATDGMKSDGNELKAEYENAKKANWKMVKNTDVQEVVRTFGPMEKEARDKIFFEWLFMSVEKEMHEELRHAWEELEKNFNVECDSV